MIKQTTEQPELARTLKARAERYAALREQRFAEFGVERKTYPASLLYHLHSRLSPEWDCPLSVDEVSKLTLDLDYKRYNGSPTVALPNTPLQTSLEETIRRRRTAERFGHQPIELEQLGTLFQLACGLTRTGRLPLRAAPSPGGLFASESYTLAYNVTGLPAGLYHYAPLDNVLEHVRESEGVSELWPALPGGWIGETPAAVIVLAARLPRLQMKYAERGYRFALIESGHIAQNLLLVSTSLNLAVVSLGGFFDNALSSLIGVDGEREVALYAILIGRSE